MPNKIKYNPQEHWEAIGKASAPGTGNSSGLFGTDGAGNSLYKLPGWTELPQYWEYISSGIRVLDIGSGNGLQIGRLTQRGIDAVGCDISFTLLAVAKGNMISHGVNKGSLVQWDGLNLPFASSTFDRVTTNTVLQHVVDDIAVESIFSEVSRLLKSRGLFLVCELVSPNDIQTATHVKLRSIQTYQSIAAKYGFQMMKVRHTVSTYVVFQAMYGRFVARSSGSSNRDNLQDVTENNHLKSSQKIKSVAKRYLRYLFSILAKFMDRLLIFFHLDDRLAGQDEMVFEKHSAV